MGIVCVSPRKLSAGARVVDPYDVARAGGVRLERIVVRSEAAATPTRDGPLNLQARWAWA